MRALLSLLLIWSIGLPSMAFGREYPELKLSFPAADVVQIEICKGSACEPLCAEAPSFGAEDLHTEYARVYLSENADRNLRRLYSLLEALNYPALMSTFVMTISGIVAPHWLSDTTRACLFLPPISVFLVAGHLGEKIEIRKEDREEIGRLLAQAVKGQVPADVGRVNIPRLRAFLARAPERCRRALSSVPREESKLND